MPYEKTADGRFRRAVFCDFDGTISSRETFAGMFQAMVPDLAAQLLPEISSGRMSIRQGVLQLIRAVPSSEAQRVVGYVDDKRTRSGLEEFVDFLASRGVPLVVVSGGLRGMVERMLGPLAERVYAIHALDLDTSGPYLDVRSEYQSGEELMDKERVKELVNAEFSVCVGDGITDLNLALSCGLVYARDRLCGLLDERGRDYVPWDDFHDVREDLARRWDGE